MKSFRTHLLERTDQAQAFLRGIQNGNFTRVELEAAALNNYGGREIGSGYFSRVYSGFEGDIEIGDWVFKLSKTNTRGRADTWIKFAELCQAHPHPWFPKILGVGRLRDGTIYGFIEKIGPNDHILEQIPTEGEKLIAYLVKEGGLKVANPPFRSPDLDLFDTYKVEAYQAVMFHGAFLEDKVPGGIDTAVKHLERLLNDPKGFVEFWREKKSLNRGFVVTITDFPVVERVIAFGALMRALDIKLEDVKSFVELVKPLNVNLDLHHENWGVKDGKFKVFDPISFNK